MRGVEYAGGGGTLLEMWNMQEEVGHCERCGICWRRWDIARGVEYAGVGGTLREVCNMQE